MKHNDCAAMYIRHAAIDYDGYMPRIGIFGGDGTHMTICMDCGQIQNWKQITDEMIIENDELFSKVCVGDIHDEPFKEALTSSGFKLENGQTISFPKI